MNKLKPRKYQDNLEKVDHIVNQLDLIVNYGMDSLVFNLKNATCEIVYNEHALELTFEDSNYTMPESLIFHDTTKLEFYRLMLFITDNIRVNSKLLS